MAVAIVPPTKQEDLSEYWDNSGVGGGSLACALDPWRSTLSPIQFPLPAPHTHMALGETVRTTYTSLGSPNYLHPEDCGKLRVMWILFQKASCIPEQYADHSGLFPARLPVSYTEAGHHCQGRAFGWKRRGEKHNLKMAVKSSVYKLVLQFKMRL